MQDSEKQKSVVSNFMKFEMDKTKTNKTVRNILTTVFCLLTTFFLATSLLAQAPQWWYTRGVIDTNRTPNDYAPLEQGQLKWMAKCAYNEMESLMGAGSNIAAMVNSFSTTNGYRLANIGQLKYVGSKFYDRLYELNLTNTLPANMPGHYPWGNSSGTNDYAMANIGQAKYVFSFNSSRDSDGDGYSDWMEAQWGSDQSSTSSIPHAGISGRITSAGPQAGTIYVVLATNEVGGGTVAYQSLSQTGLYAFTNLSVLRTYWIMAWRESNGNFSNDSWEAQGNSTANPVYLAGNVTNANITLSGPDSDGDGLPDWWEIAIGTSPSDTDSDDDGMPDGWEVEHGLNPCLNDAESDYDGDGLSNIAEYSEWWTEPNDYDTDDDGMPDGWEVAHECYPCENDAASDNDSDGLTNLQEFQHGTDPWKSDTDDDGMPDVWEVTYGLNPCVDDTQDDYDGDGLNNIEEYTHQTLPNDCDTDNDGMPDGWEHDHGLILLSNDAASDHDGDGLSNLQEYRLGTYPDSNESDGDLMPDYWEVTHGLNPVLNDAAGDPDNDSLSNYAEYQNGTDPNYADTDYDGMPDAWEVTYHSEQLDPLVNDANNDADEDGLTNLQEYQHGTDPNCGDTDNDGLLDGWELEHGFNPLVNDVSLDSDADGLTDLQECQYNTDPHSSDTDSDGLPDVWEVAQGTYPLVNDAASDPDNDGLTNLQEYQLGTDPHNPDTDFDGLPDGWENQYGLNSVSAPPASLIGCWKLDETNGVVVADCSHGNNGTAYGAQPATPALSGVEGGVIHGAWAFNGLEASNRISIANSSVYKTPQLTALVYVNFDSLAGSTNEGFADRMTILSRPDSTSNCAYALYKSSDNALVFELTNSLGHTNLALATVTNFVGTGIWYHVTGVFDGTNAELYVDGIIVPVTNRPASLVLSTNSGLVLGNDISGTAGLCGRLDHVMIYKTALSSNQVYSLGIAGRDDDHDGLSGSQEYDVKTDPTMPNNQMRLLFDRYSDTALWQASGNYDAGERLIASAADKNQTVWSVSSLSGSSASINSSGILSYGPGGGKYRIGAALPGVTNSAVEMNLEVFKLAFTTNFVALSLANSYDAFANLATNCHDLSRMTWSVQTVSGDTAQVSSCGVVSWGYNGGEYLVRAVSNVKTNSWDEMTLVAAPCPVLAFNRAEDFIMMTFCDICDAKWWLTSYSTRTNINWSLTTLAGTEAGIDSDGLMMLNFGWGKHQVEAQSAANPSCCATIVVNIVKLDEFSLTAVDNQAAYDCSSPYYPSDNTVYPVENAQSNAWMDLKVAWSPGVTGVMWQIESADGTTNDLWRWSALGGLVTNSSTNRLTWSGGPEATNRDYIVRIGFDANTNGQLESGESGYYLNAKVLSFDRLVASNAWYGAVDATAEGTNILYLMINTNGTGQLTLHEKLLPGQTGLQELEPSPVPVQDGMRFYWTLTNRYDAGAVEGWNATNGYLYQNGIYSNTITWTGGTNVEGRDFVLRMWHDADNDQELDADESRRSVFVKPVYASAGDFNFVPMNSVVPLSITVSTSSLSYSLVLTRESGASGWATFDDGSTNLQVNGSTNILVRGMGISSGLKNMRLKAVTSCYGEPIELFRRDFTVGTIQLQACNAWSGMTNMSLPLTDPAKAVAVVPPGDSVWLRAITEPANLAQSIGWQVVENVPLVTVVNGACIKITILEPCSLPVSLTIGDPQYPFPHLKLDSPWLIGVEGNTVTAPSEPSATAITDPAGYGDRATMTYEKLETYYSAGGANGGKYKVTASLFGHSITGECIVEPEEPDEPLHGDGRWISQYPEHPCAVCSVIGFSYIESIGGTNKFGNANWTGDGVPENTTNTPYCSVEPMGPSNNFIVTADGITNHFATYADDLQSLGCGGVTVTDESKTLYIAYDQHPGITATKFCGNCPWNTWISGPVSDQHSSGNTLTGNLNLASPGAHAISVSKGQKSLTLNVEGIKAEFVNNDPLNLPWTQNGYHNMNDELADIYSPAGLIWSGGASNNGVLYFGSNAASYNIHVVSSNLPSCGDNKTVHLINIDIRQTETNVWVGSANVTLDMTNSCLGDKTADWTSSPIGISGSGSSISFNPANVAPGTYIVTAESTALPECSDTCIVHIPNRDNSGGRDTNSPQPDKSSTTEPINTMSGANYFNENDLVIPCPGLSLEFVRGYNSAFSSTGTFGKGWTHSYEWSLTPIINYAAEPLDWMMLRTADGREFRFPKDGESFGPCVENNLKLETSGSGYSVTFPAGVVYSFNANGALENIKDAWNNTLTLSYTGNNLTQVAHGNGQSLTFTYDGNGRLANVLAATNLMVGFGYDGQGRLTSATRHVSGKTFVTTYEYNNDSAVTRRTNSRGDEGEYGYTTNAAGAAVKGNSLNFGGYYTHSLAYDTNKTTVTYTRGAVNQTIEYHYNPEILRLTEVNGPADKGVTYQYDNNDNITNEITTGSSDTLTAWRQYDTNHNVTQAAIGYNATPANPNTYEWNATYQLPTLVTDPEGNKTGFEYQNGAISRVKAYYTAYNSYDTIYTYNGNGLVSQVATPNGATVSYTYDAYGHPATMTPSAGSALTYQYSQLGHLEKVTWPDNRHIDYDSDAQGWVKTITYPDNSTETFAYDGIGNLTNHVDQAGRTTRMTYLPTRKMASVSRDLNGQPVTIAYSYDQQMNTLVIRDALNRPVEGYQLDIQDRPVTITNIDGQTMSVTYGVENFVKSMTRFDGTMVNNTYNGDGRLSQISYPNATLTFDYYADGMVRSVGDSSGTVSNEYNTLNRLIKTKGVTSGSEVSYGYHPAGQVSAVTSVVGVVSYSLDAGDRLNAIASDAGTFNYSYNANNGLISRVFCSVLGVSNTFDVLDRVTGITWQNSTNSVVRSFAYAYNAVGMVTQKVTTANSLQSTNLYEYDDLDRLVSESSFSSQTSAVSLYSYDLVGNRTQAVVNGQTAVDYTYGSANRLTSWGTNGENTLSYNTAGCVTEISLGGGNTRVLAWDSRYRVTSIATNGTTAESYGYDALGRRVSISDGATTTYLVYDGIHCVAETDSSGNLLKSYNFGPGIDNILSMTVYGGTTNTYYYVKDHLGSVQAVVDSSGSVIESYKYDAWGNVLGVYDSTGGVIQASAVGNRYLWQGREYSWKTGLYYFRARWYEPVTGRWLSNDPIGISGGLNQYVFADNNPVNFKDPMGLLRDIDRDVDKYVKDLKKANLKWWQVKKLYKFSISEGRDTKWDNETLRFKGYAGGGSQMGNVKAGYALSEVYGPVWAWIMTRGAEMVAPFERSSYNLFTVFWFDPVGSFEQNDIGIEMWKSEQNNSECPNGNK